MNYYRTNALYDYLAKHPKVKYYFCSGNMWQLVYGDSYKEPKVLVLAVGVSSKEYISSLSHEETYSWDLLKILSDKSKVPTRYIRFVCDSPEIETVRTFSTSAKCTEVSMQELAVMFNDYGLPLSGTRTNKAVNDMISSAYHKWQREFLGNSIVVSDLDLWKFDSNGDAESIFELKRSIVSINEWVPYKADYSNFALISNLLNKAGINFKIAYNIRRKSPVHDDISAFQLFDVDFSQPTPIVRAERLTLKEFIST